MEAQPFPSQLAELMFSNYWLSLKVSILGEKGVRGGGGGHCSCNI